MTNSEYLEKTKKYDDKKKLPLKGSVDQIIEYRKTKALEIIAETLINLTTPLENIETILNRK